MRGISSMAKKVTPRSARARAASAAVSGSPKPMTVWPWRSSARSAAPVSGFAPGLRTCRITSAVRNTSSRLAARRTPFSVYSESGKPACDAGARFHQQFDARLVQNGDGARDHRHAALARRCFGDESDDDSHVDSRSVLTTSGRGWRVPVLQQFRGAEEERHFDRGRFRRVRPVNAVALDARRRTACGWCLRRRWPDWWRPSLRATS